MAAHKQARHKNRVALVLQGGGALGAYQAGVFEAMHEHDLVPDWVVGTSIGAINAAIIAGNKPVDQVSRLQEFWRRVAHEDSFDLTQVIDSARQFNTWLSTLDSVVHGVHGFFSPRLFSTFATGFPVAPEEASFYDTSALAATLKELIDFDYLNAPDSMRLTVNALKVTCGELVNFDKKQQTIGIEHIMASCALPPGLPPVRIDGELYWDGGLYSNTPLETVLDDQPPVDTLCFMVELWNAHGPEPTTLDSVYTRQKDVMYASRSKRHIEAYLHTHQLQCMIRRLYEKLPQQLKAETDKEVLAALDQDSTIHVVRVPYRGQDWHMAAKDINFSRGSLEWRWHEGYQDATRVIKQASWLADANTNHDGVVVHEFVVDPVNQPAQKPERGL